MTSHLTWDITLDLLCIEWSWSVTFTFLSWTNESKIKFNFTKNKAQIANSKTHNSRNLRKSSCLENIKSKTIMALWSKINWNWSIEKLGQQKVLIPWITRGLLVGSESIRFFGMALHPRTSWEPHWNDCEEF